MNRLERKQENNIIHNNIKTLRYLGINLMKVMKDLWNESYNSPKKEIKWKGIAC
jgi:hypothetical protein